MPTSIQMFFCLGRLMPFFVIKISSTRLIVAICSLVSPPKGLTNDLSCPSFRTNLSQAGLMVMGGRSSIGTWHAASVTSITSTMARRAQLTASDRKCHNSPVTLTIPTPSARCRRVTVAVP